MLPTSNKARMPSAVWVAYLALLMPLSAQAKKPDPYIAPAPRLAPAVRDNSFDRSQFVEPKNVPDFAQGTNTPLKAEAASSVLPLQTRLKLVLETGVDSKSSRPGDIFEAHVRDDLFVGS